MKEFAKAVIARSKAWYHHGESHDYVVHHHLFQGLLPKSFSRVTPASVFSGFRDLFTHTRTLTGGRDRHLPPLTESLGVFTVNHALSKVFGEEQRKTVHDAVFTRWLNSKEAVASLKNVSPEDLERAWHEFHSFRNQVTIELLRDLVKSYPRPEHAKEFQLHTSVLGKHKLSFGDVLTALESGSALPDLTTKQLRAVASTVTGYYSLLGEYTKWESAKRSRVAEDLGHFFEYYHDASDKYGVKLFALSRALPKHSSK